MKDHSGPFKIQKYPHGYAYYEYEANGSQPENKAIQDSKGEFDIKKYLQSRLKIISEDTYGVSIQQTETARSIHSWRWTART